MCHTKYFFDTFYDEYKWRVSQVGEMSALIEYLMNQPAVITLPCYYHEQIELAKKFGSIPQDATEKEAEILETQSEQAIAQAEKLMNIGKWMDFADQLAEVYDMFSSTIQDMVDIMNDNVQRAYKNQMATLRASERYQNANDASKLNMEKKLQDGLYDERKKAFNAQKALSASNVIMSTATAMMDAWEKFWWTGGQPWISLIAAAGAMQLGLIATQRMPEFAHGGLIGGQPHSQGGTPILAEQGEFIMSRRAVSQLGVDNMEKINNLVYDLSNHVPIPLTSTTPIKSKVTEGREFGRYEKGGLVGSMSNREMRKRGSQEINLVVNFEGNILSEDFIIEEALPIIKDAIRRGEHILD